MFFYLHGVIIFYVNVLFFLDTNILSISSAHFTFIISNMKIYRIMLHILHFLSVFSLIEEAERIVCRLSLLALCFLHLLKILFIKFAVVWFASEPSIILSCFAEHS